MRRFSIPFSTLLTVLLASLTYGLAQAPTTFKGVVIGDELGWETNRLALTLEVAQATDVRLGVESPGFDPDDYRAALRGEREVGDERYDDGTGEVMTTFSLLYGGQEVTSQTYGIEPHREDALFEGRLEPGVYTLTAELQGLAKNAFTYTLDSSQPDALTLYIEPDQLLVDPQNSVSESTGVNYTVSRGDWQQAFALEVPDFPRPVTVGIYDGDGSGELQFRLQNPDATRQELGVSGDLEWRDYTLNEVGRYGFDFRIPNSAYQYSNTVGVRVDQRLRVDADALRVVAPATFTLTKAVDRSEVQPGDTLAYTLTATNTGGSLGTATLTDTLPAGLEGERLEETFTLPPGESRSFSVEAQVTEDAGDELVNEAMLDAATGEVRAQAPVTVFRAAPGSPAAFTLTKEVTPEVARPGDTVTYTLTVTNRGGSAGRVWLADVIPYGIRGEFETQALDLAAGETQSVTVTGMVTEDAPDTVINGSAVADAETLATSTARANLKVERAPGNFTLTKSANVDTATVGDSVYYLLTVTNVGESAGEVTLKDQLVAGLEGEALNETFELAAGDTRTFAVNATITEAAGEMLSNSATLQFGDQTVSASADVAVERPEMTVDAEEPTAEPAEPLDEAQNDFELNRFSRIVLEYQVGDILSCDLGDFAPGETKTLGVTYTGVAGEARFRRSLSADGLTLGETTPTVENGETSYRVRITNGAQRTENVVLTEPLPPGAELVGASYVCRDAVQGASRVLVSHQPPAGGTYLAGSSLINNEASDDPFVDEEGRLYYALPYSASGEVSYTVQHTGSLGATLPPSLTVQTAEREVYLVGEVSFDAVPSEVADTPVNQVQGAGIEVRPLDAMADGRNPLTFELRAVTEDGTAAEVPYLTLESSLDFQDPDAAPELSGYQVKLTDGVGTLRLRPRVTPTTLTLRLAYDNDEDADFDVIEAVEVFIPGSGSGIYQYQASVTLTTAAGVNVEGEVRGYAELPLGSGTLQVATDVGVTTEDGFALDRDRGLSTDTDPDDRFPLTGAGQEAAPALRSDDGVAVRYDQNRFSAGYYADDLGVPGVSGLAQGTALRGEVRGDLGAKAFVGFLPEPTTTVEITPDGTRFYDLETAIEPQSERLTLVTVAGERVLERLEDYQIDYPNGTIFLAQPLQPLDKDFNPVTLRVDYAPADEDAARQLAYGAGVSYQTGAVSFSVGGAFIDSYRLGAEAAYRTEGFGASASYRLDYDPDAAEDEQVSHTLGVNADGEVGSFEFGVALTYTSNLAGNDLRGTGRVAYRVFEDGRVVATHQGGTTSNRTALLYEQGLGAFVVGAGADYTWESGSVGVVGLVGYGDDRFDAQLKHSQPLSGEAEPRSTFQASYQLDANLSANASASYEWGETLEAVVGLTQQLGTANLTLDYQLPTLDGGGNRARFGVVAPFAITDTLSVDASAGYTANFNDDTSAASFGVSARYTLTRFTATLGTDVAISEEVKVVVRVGASGQIARNQTLSFDANAQIAPELDGSFTAAYALRGSSFNLLTYHRLKKSGDETLLEGEVAPTYAPSDAFQLRSNVAYRVNFTDTDATAYQASLFGTYYFDLRFGGSSDDDPTFIPYDEGYKPTFGVGGGVVYLLQPGTDVSRVALGLEGSVQVIDPVWLTLGYLFDRSFGGLTPDTRGGLYLRMDLLGGGQF